MFVLIVFLCSAQASVNDVCTLREDPQMKDWEVSDWNLGKDLFANRYDTTAECVYHLPDRVYEGRVFPLSHWGLNLQRLTSQSRLTWGIDDLIMLTICKLLKKAPNKTELIFVSVGSCLKTAKPLMFCDFS